MAETRKHRITIRDELDAQLMAQMGDSVRPYEAGAHHSESGEAAATPPTPPKTGTIGGIPGVALGAYSFGTKRSRPDA